ncbi:hypothetical protein QY884_02515 [Latilactobacillus sakei]
MKLIIGRRLTKHRLKANPSEPMAIINKRDLGRALAPTTTQDLKDKYYVRDYAVKRAGRNACALS